jgi:heme iron utilization protein
MTGIAAENPALTARRLLRGARTAALASRMAAGAAEGWPHASLVLLATAPDAAPILLLSRLAEHTRNLGADERVALLVDGTADLAEPLTGARLSVQGRARHSADPADRARYLRRHPSAAAYADFGDFAFYRVAVERAHLVAGFGRIHWLTAAEVLYGGPTDTLAATEADIVAHMNQDHADAIQLYANVLLGATGEGWVMAGCDNEGCDLARDGRLLRLDFDQPAITPDDARRQLVRLAKRARQPRLEPRDS